MVSFRCKVIVTFQVNMEVILDFLGECLQLGSLAVLVDGEELEHVLSHLLLLG